MFNSIATMNEEDEMNGSRIFNIPKCSADPIIQEGKNGSNDLDIHDSSNIDIEELLKKTKMLSAFIKEDSMNIFVDRVSTNLTRLSLSSRSQLNEEPHLPKFGGDTTSAIMQEVFSKSEDEMERIKKKYSAPDNSQFHCINEDESDDY